MEDNQFWDELANRLRQEQAQPFQEGDWAAVHQRVRAKGKRRAVWFWPLVVGLALIGNNLVWYLLPSKAATPSTQESAAMQHDTVILIRERLIRDTVWQKMPPPLFKPAEQSRLPSQPATLPQPILNTTTVPEALPAFTLNSAAHPPEMAIMPRVPNVALGPQQSVRLELLAPFTASIVLARSAFPLLAKHATSLLIAADAGGAAFLSEKISRMHLWQAGASLYLMPGKWGATAGLRRLHAVENPAPTKPELGLAAECATCPGSPDFPDRVSVQWTEFQMGLAYRFALPKQKTELLLSVAGQLRGPVEQYRHFIFENYGSPPVEVDDWYRQESGLYWNGWSSSVSVVHRIAGNFGVSGSVQGRWTSGVNPGLMPASIGLHAGLVWYVRGK